MIRIGTIPLPPGGDMEQLRKRAARALGVRPGELGELEIVPTMCTPWRCPWPGRSGWWSVRRDEM